MFARDASREFAAGGSKLRICFVTSRFPYPLDKGDKTRAYQQIRHLSTRHCITLVAASTGPVSTAHFAALECLCERIEIVPLSRAGIAVRLLNGLGRRRPLQVAYFGASTIAERVKSVLREKPHDIVHASLVRALPAVDQIDFPVFVDFMDAFSRGMETRMQCAPWWQRPAYGLERDRLIEFERAACARYQRVGVTSRVDQTFLGFPNVMYLPQGIDLEAFDPARARALSGTIVMTGNMGFQPNVDAATWFARSVWPRVLQRRPALRFEIVGTRPAAAVRALDRAPGITVVGEVPDIASVLRTAQVAVCPMRCGAGIQTKLLEAMATGVPTVATSMGNSGVGGLHERDLLVADDAEDFATAVLRLIEDRALSSRLARSGREHVRRWFSWEAHARTLEEQYFQTIASTGAAAAVGLE